MGHAYRGKKVNLLDLLSLSETTALENAIILEPGFSVGCYYLVCLPRQAVKYWLHLF